MSKPIVVQHQTVGVHEYQGTNEEGEVVLLALHSYGFLLNKPDMQLHKYTFDEFANAIEMHYDTSNPQTAEIVRVLRVVHERNATPKN
jgi:hypothetical protein